MPEKSHFSRLDATGLASVSYTHLDVYKRQRETYPQQTIELRLPCSKIPVKDILGLVKAISYVLWFLNGLDVLVFALSARASVCEHNNT